MLGAMAIAATAFTLSAHAQATAIASRYDDPAPYCAAVGILDKPDGRYVGPTVPDWVAKALMAATGVPATAPLEFFKHAAWRCVDGRVLVCSYGANIPCDTKANSSRHANAGTRRFCRDNPYAGVVPAVATGRAAIYEWRCLGGKPAIVRQVFDVDAQGFVKAFWYRATPE